MLASYRTKGYATGIASTSGKPSTSRTVRRPMTGQKASRRLRTTDACFQCQVLRHPGMQGRDYILEKLMTFHTEHGTPMESRVAGLQHAADQLPGSSHAAEARPLSAIVEKSRSSRGRVKQIGELLPVVLAKLGVSVLQSDTESRGSH
ncbi:MAG: hypothetical protein ABGZ35_14725 [Planctomycetaceae bacterium]